MMRMKKKNIDLKEHYTLFLEIGLIVTLLIFLVATKVDFRTESKEMTVPENQDVVTMEESVQTEQMDAPPPPPRPPVPVEVPNDEVIADQTIDINADLNVNETVKIPPPPEPEGEEKEEEDEDNFFVVVEQMPELKGGLQSLHEKIKYPKKARKAGIEGRVMVQFIINEEGNVENPKVIRGIGGGCDEEALRIVKQAEFVPGHQRGKPVRVQYTLPIIFRLQAGQQ